MPGCGAALPGPRGRDQRRNEGTTTPSRSTASARWWGQRRSTTRFCENCGSTVYGDFTVDAEAITGIAVGNFVDPDFPTPAIEAFTGLRHHRVPPVPDAVQSDPGA
jgi:hypothetical protein